MRVNCEGKKRALQVTLRSGNSYGDFRVLQTRGCSLQHCVAEGISKREREEDLTEMSDELIQTT